MSVKGACFAHIMGTLQGGIEVLPGTEASTDFARNTFLEEDSLHRRNERGNVVVRIKHDAATLPMRRFLSATVRSCQELYGNIRHLGLPKTSVCDKMPWYR